VNREQAADSRTFDGMDLHWPKKDMQTEYERTWFDRTTQS